MASATTATAAMAEAEVQVDVDELFAWRVDGPDALPSLPAEATVHGPLPIAVLPSVTSGEFNERFRHKKPVKLTEQVRSWPAVARWSDPDYLAGLLPADTKVEVLVSKNNLHFFKLALCKTEEMMYRDVIQHIFRPTPEQASRRIYCRLPLLPEFLADMSLPDDITGTPSVFKVANCGVWMSSAGNITPLHFDLCHGFLVQIVGEKQWSYFDPDDYRCLYPAAGSDPNPHSSRVQLDVWLAGDKAERERFPRVADATRFDASVGPGDLIYTPPFWWHQVHTVSPSVSVLIPFDPLPHEPIHPCAQL